ncbi:MAG: enolase C-terminal domain-like protein [Chloroflexota bacterium]|nr:enolase C-terminal domain-like protein [Chloroflexota bacterium]
MPITDIRPTVLLERALWSRPEAHSTRIAADDRTREVGPGYKPRTPGSVLVEIESDDGLVGLGLGGGGHPGAYVIEHYLKPLLLGQDPVKTQSLWERMYRATIRYGQAGIVLMAMSGIDLALWDLRGKQADKPVYDILGEKRKERVPVYVTNREPSWAKERGFAGVKFGAPYGPLDGQEGMRKNEAFIASAREQVGPDVDLMIDCSCTWDVEYTIEMAHILAPYGLAFIEEPLLPNNIAGYSELRRKIDSTRIATGEHFYTHHAFRPLLETEGADIIQPDIRWTGGLSELLRIYDLATEYDIPVLPHRGGMAWSLHFILAHENCPLAEGLPLTEQEAVQSVFAGEPVPTDGYLTVGDSPGFGLRLIEDRIPEFRIGD